MHTMTRPSLSAACGWLAVAALLAAAAGCGSANARSLSLDPVLAKQSLTTFLETWKQGKDLGALKAQTPSIVAGDEAWSAGSKLVAYKISGHEFNDGANLHLTVELLLSSKKKKAGKTTVTYIVGTSPVITIFRK